VKIIDINKNKEKSIKEAVKVLKGGGMIVYPTETCYGIGVDAQNPDALSKIMQYKTLRGSKPISIAVCSIDMAKKYVKLNEMALNIYKNYLPGPITVISKSNGILKPPVVSATGGVGVRYPDYAYTLELLQKFGRPITATSANVSYRPTPYSIQKLIKDLPKQNLQLIDLFLDAGELPKNSPSTVLDTTMNQLTTLRQGEIEFENSLKKDILLEKKISKSTEETIKFAQYFTKKYINPEIPCVIALSGELGAGKTQFAKGMAKQLNVKEIVNSPTYTIINEYEYEFGGKKKTLAHMDTWRLEDDEFEKSGLVEHIKNEDIVIIEWADKFYQEIGALCDNMNVRMYKVVIKYLSLNERSLEIHG